MRHYKRDMTLDESLKKFDTLKVLIHTVDNLLSVRAQVEGADSLGNLAFQNRSLFEAMISSMRYFDLRVLYPNTLWTSLFLTGYALFENTLDELSDYFAEKKRTALLPKDLNYKGIKRSIVFLTKVAVVSFPETSLYLEKIQKTNKIRNCLAHGGKIGNYSKPEEIKALLDNDNKHLAEKNDYLVLSKEYVVEFFDHCRFFLKETSDQIFSE